MPSRSRKRYAPTLPTITNTKQSRAHIKMQMKETNQLGYKQTYNTATPTSGLTGYTNTRGTTKNNTTNRTNLLYFPGVREPSNNNSSSYRHSRTMNSDDLKHLVWFYSEGTTIYERSVQGTMLERAWLYSSPPTGRFRKGLELTAQPRKSYQSNSSEDHGFEVAESLTLKHGAVSSRLAQLTPEHQAALKLIHGDIGASFARMSCGAIGSLILIVPTGQELVSREQFCSIHVVSAVETLRNIILLSDIKGKHKPTLAKALVEAHALYSAASRAYANTRHS